MAGAIEIILVAPRLERVQSAIAGERTLRRGTINRALRDVGKVLVPALRRHTPRLTGKLANSTTAQVMGARDDQRLEVRQEARSLSGDFYGHFVREGTRAHVIVPVRARAMRFMVGGRVVFAARVHHPGTAPNPYHERALAESRSAIDAIIAEANNAFGKRMAGTVVGGTN